MLDDELKNKRELLELLKGAEWSKDGMCPECKSRPGNVGHGHVTLRRKISLHAHIIAACPMQSQIERLEREIRIAEAAVAGENCCMGHPGCNCRENLPAGWRDYDMRLGRCVVIPIPETQTETKRRAEEILDAHKEKLKRIVSDFHRRIEELERGWRNE